MDDIILDVLGDSPRIRVLCVLLNGYDVAKPVGDIAEFTDLNVDAVSDELNELELWGVAEESVDGWKMRSEDEVVQKLTEMEWAIIDRLIKLDEIGRLEEVTGSITE